MTDNVLYGIDFSAKRDLQKLQGLSQAMVPDECFITPEMSIEERVRRSIYHSAGLPYPKDRA